MWFLEPWKNKNPAANKTERMSSSVNEGEAVEGGVGESVGIVEIGVESD